jgi:hypothetical protein
MFVCKCKTDVTAENAIWITYGEQYRTREDRKHQETDKRIAQNQTEVNTLGSILNTVESS